MRFSVIAPVYGVEKYLDTFVRSVLSQTFTDFELILVDDSSPDNCPEMCDGYAERDCRVRVIHKPQNEGLGFARNTGIEAALGDYVIFADSDDYLDPAMLQECNAMLDSSTDILVFGVKFCHENKQGNITRIECAIPKAFSASHPKEKADMFAMLNRNRVFQYAWNKVYRREFMLKSGVIFEKTKLIEDFLFNIAIFPKAQNITSVDKAYYNYRKPQHETLASRYSPEFFELCKRKYQLEKQFLVDCDALDEHIMLIHEMYVKHFVSCVLRNRSKSAALSKAVQRKLVCLMCADPITVEVVNSFRPNSTVYKIICKKIKKCKARSIMTVCSLVELAQKRLNAVFRILLKRR